MTICLNHVELRKVDITTRMPFRYGIATLSAVPYLLVFADFEVDGQKTRGVAADVLPPKWFTKQPNAAIEDEIEEMLGVIRVACDFALEVGTQENMFDWWRPLYDKQMKSEKLKRLPSLLKGFGVSLLERAAIDATCRRHSMSFHNAIHRNLLGIRLGDLHPELQGSELAQYLPAEPSATISVRHTVGLADPLEDKDITAADRLDDGLPQSLEACLQEYGITHLKIKVPAEIEEARTRLMGIESLLRRLGRDCQFTLDGNEFYTDASEFRSFWEKIRLNEEQSSFIDTGLLAVEQPLHRDVALSDETRQVFQAWKDRPPLIIDESDGEIQSLQKALDVGYVGTSHKNCKGVIKGLANACLLKHKNRQLGRDAFVCTGEDLMNIGPVALLQDLSVGAAIGLTHIERNGHHYVAGLSQFPEQLQQQVLKFHGDLYHEHETQGVRFPTLAINQGQLRLDSINQAPFGYAMELDAVQFDLIERF